MSEKRVKQPRRIEATVNTNWSSGLMAIAMVVLVIIMAGQVDGWLSIITPFLAGWVATEHLALRGRDVKLLKIAAEAGGGQTSRVTRVDVSATEGSQLRDLDIRITTPRSAFMSPPGSGGIASHRII